MRCNFGRLTAAKRHILEDPDLYYTTEEGSTELTELSRAEQRSRRRKVCEKLAMVPGKLDHATVVAYQVVTAIQISEFLHKTTHLRIKRGLLSAKKCKLCSTFSFHGTEETKQKYMSMAKSLWTFHWDWEQQVIQLCATRWHIVTICRVSWVSFVAPEGISALS